MKIIYDVETYPNFFCVTFKPHTGKAKYYEISERANDSEKIYKMLKRIEDNNFTLAGYNNHGYDDLMLNEFVKLYELTQDNLNEKLKAYNDYLFLNKPKVPNDGWLLNIFGYYNSIDLTNQISDYKNGFKSFPNLKEVGLKLNCNYIELPFDPSKEVSLDDMNTLKEYNLNDVLVTEKLLDDYYNKNHFQIIDTLIELNYLKKGKTIFYYNVGQPYFIEEIFKKKDNTKDKLESSKSLIIKDILEEHGLNSFSEFINRISGNEIYIKEVKIEPTGRKRKQQVINKLYAGEVEIENFQIKLGEQILEISQGGLHSKSLIEIEKSCDKFILLNIDVASMYPNVMINNGLLHSEHEEILQGILQKRLEAKKNNDKNVNLALKLLINTVYGKLKVEKSNIFNVAASYMTCLHGQIITTCLCKQLSDIGCKIINANTDGLLIKIEKNLLEEVTDIVKLEEEIFNITWEIEPVKFHYQTGVNDYIQILESGKMKTGGKIFRTLKNDLKDLNKSYTTYLPRFLKDWIDSNYTLEFKKWMNEDLKHNAINYLMIKKSSKGFRNGERLKSRLLYYYTTSTGEKWTYQNVNGSTINLEVDKKIKTINSLEEIKAKDIDYKKYEEIISEHQKNILEYEKLNSNKEYNRREREKLYIK